MIPCLGIDIGSATTKAVVLGEGGLLGPVLYRRRDQDDAAALDAFLEDIEARQPTKGLKLGSVGSEAGSLFRGASAVNGILATAAGVRTLHPEARAVLEVGGHTSKLIAFGDRGEVRDFATNEACAAGTGSFLEQQARRLGLSIRELSELAAGARRAATIAGRCSVFAASDMIHLQQKGTPLPEIAYGLCMAIVRNDLATLVKGKRIAAPVVIAGGCARNEGILRAFREALDFADPALFLVSSQPGLEGAIGAALAARDSEMPELPIAEVRRLLSALLSRDLRSATTLAPLRRRIRRAAPAEPACEAATDVEGFLGVDVGSVSTDVVVLDEGGEPISSVYLPTRGRPAEVLYEALSVLERRFGPHLSVLGCGATGSGRHLAGRLVGADVVKNEITCQLLAAQRYFPDVDTVFEIGGQDSKFIAVRDGAMSDFAMNKVCAAGTGSFLEEQSRDLGIDVCRDFAPRAFAGAPLDLGSRCTVFMGTEVVGALGAGAAVEDVCAGLAYSIVRNYLDKVVGPRPVGRRVVFQGGVASNDAVVAAFERALGREIEVHPFNRVSGAIGAALAARSARAAAAKPAASRFTGFAPRQGLKLKSFECRHCSNRCEVNVIAAGTAGRAFFGDTCERYTSRESSLACPVPNLAAEYLERCEALFSRGGGSGLSIGVPRASSLLGALPFWATFFQELGHRPVLSDPSSPETLALGLEHLSVGMCLPMKLVTGHVHGLLARGVDLVFVPAITVLPGDDPARSFSCPYTMAEPFLVGAPERSRLLSPVVTFESEQAFAAGFDPYREILGVSTSSVCDAFRAARFAQRELDEVFRERAKDLIASGTTRHVFAILGRPYVTLDAYANLALFERLRRLGVLGIPVGMLPLPSDGDGRSELPWRFPADTHEAAIALAGVDDVHPALVSCFGCGPDGFAVPRIEEALGRKPHLTLEIDEHRGEAGLVTRIEAFLDQLGGGPRRAKAGSGVPRRAAAFIPKVPTSVRIPYFADHAYAFSGLFRLKGHDARVLPLPGPEIRALGERYSLGKECHAYSAIAGDLVNLQHQRAGGTVFFFPGTSIPCLLHEYGQSMESLLSRLGTEGIRVSSPNAAELLTAFGIDAIERLYVGLLAIELLAKAVCQVRPYELAAGSTDAVHRRNLERIETAIAGGDVLGALDDSLRSLAAVPVKGRRTRPIVGLAGDIYTRVNPAGNHDVVRWLEGQGLEVWPSPFQIDLIDFDISRRVHQSLASHDLSRLLVHGPVALRRELQVWRTRRVVGSQMAHRDEPGYLELKKLAAPYMPNEAHELLYLNVAKIVDFAQGGVDGIVNAICFGCMVGNASAAIIERIRRDYDGLPIITAVYSGAEDPSRRMVLEAFVGQVKAHHRRLAAPGAA